MPIGNNILMGASAQGGDDIIGQSLRFRGSEELKRSSVRSASNAAATISVWVKLGDLSSSMKRILSIESSGGAWGLGVVYNSNKFWVYDSTTTDGQASVSDAVYKDPSAWYHIVYNRSAGGTNQQLFINGIAQSGASSHTTSVDLCSIKHEIGGRDGDPNTSWKGYMAEFHFVDGSKLAETSFGKFNDDGVWVPIKYTGGHGSMGYHLKFDSSAGLGDDASTNADDFTPTGFDTAAISSSNFDNDIDFEDTPTNNHPTLNPLDKSISGSLTAGTPEWNDAHMRFRAHNTNDTVTHRVRTTMGTMGVTSGKWYFEVTRSSITSGVTPNNSWVVGWASSAPPHTSPGAGSGWTDVENYAVFDGYNGHTKANGATIQSPSSTPTEASDQIMAYAFDFDSTSNNVKLYHNNTLINTMSLDIGDSVMMPCVWSGYGSENSFNFGQMPFVFTPPSGHVGLENNAMAEPTIKDGKKHFGVLLYQGNGGTKTVTDADEVEFTPDFVWIKARTGTRNHFAFDCIRGGSNGLLTNDTNLDVNRNTFISNFVSNGFSVGADGDINANTVNTVAWCWKAGGEPTATNSAGAGNVPTAGSVKIDGANKTDALAGANPATKISANTKAGFSIVEYAGTGSQTTVAHGLTKKPEFIIIHNRESNAFKSVYHKDSYTSASDPGVLYLNRELNRQQDTNVFGTSTMTLNNTVFTVGTYEGTNASAGDKHIAYVWHSVPGFSKFGLFTGNADPDGPFVYLGFRPAFILFKSTSNSNNWQLIDTRRDPTNNGTSTVLRPDEATEESTTLLDHVDILSNGFKIRDGGGFNGTGWKISYAAFAENPFGGKNTPPVTAR